MKVEEFWSRMKNVGDCLEWTGAKNRSHGYGILSVAGRRILTHRFAYELTNGSIPLGKHVLHHCDNPACVNPSHLFLGTQKDNLDDMIRKGRHIQVRGEKHGMAKLTWEEVSEIRRLYGTEGFSQRQLGRQFAVCKSTIFWIVHGEHWKVSRPW